jgi:hypothetical protein
LVAICPALKDRRCARGEMQIENENKRWLGAECKKPQTERDCAREKNRASYAICFGQGKNDIIQCNQGNPNKISGEINKNIPIVDISDSGRILILSFDLKTGTFRTTRTSREHAPRNGACFLSSWLSGMPVPQVRAERLSRPFLLP